MPVAFSARAQDQRLAVDLPDADGVRLAARRHRHAGRHLAEHHRVAAARRARRRAVRHVRLHAGRHRARDRRRRSSSAFAWRLLPRGRKAAAAMDAAFTLEGYTTEASVPENSPAVGKTVGELEAHGGAASRCSCWCAAARAGSRPPTTPTIKAGDILLIEGEPAALDRVVDKAEPQARARGHRAGDRHADRRDRRDGSGGQRGFAAGRPHAGAGEARRALRRAPARGQPPRQAHHAAHALGAARGGRRDRAARQSPTLPETLGELRCLPLAARDLRLGRRRPQHAAALDPGARDGVRRRERRFRCRSRSSAPRSRCC